jgi:hypothetical protein
MPEIVLAVAIGFFTIVTAYLGVHLTMHPPETNRAKWIYKGAFLFCGIITCVLIGIQAKRNQASQGILTGKVNNLTEELKRVEAKMLVTKTGPSPATAQATTRNSAKQPESRLSPTITQTSEGVCSPNIVGNDNSTSCAPAPKLTASVQLQQKMPSGEWLTSFSVSSNVLIQTGDLKLLCDAPVLRAGISRINSAEFVSGSNGPNPSNPNEAVYELGPEMLSPGAVAVVGVYSNTPVHILSGSLGSQRIIFAK